MAQFKNELPEGLRHSVLTGPAALIQVLDIILATQPDSRSTFGKAILQVRARVLESIQHASKVEGLSADCQSVLLQILAGPVAGMFLAVSETDPTGVALKLVNVVVPVQAPLIDDKALSYVTRGGAV